MNEKLSPYPELHDACTLADGRIPLSWVRTTEQKKLSNLGDALSPVVVAAISGLPVAHRHFNDSGIRMTASGTIAQAMSQGVVHLWGTGLDAGRRALEPCDAPFEAAPDTRYVVHAVRGMHSRTTLLDAGIHVPPIYGDPGWFMPRIYSPNVEKKYELGVILHISQLESPDVVAKPSPNALCWNTSENDGVKLISTWHEPSWEGFCNKIVEILECRRIISHSFHGLCLADAYGIPCAYIAHSMMGPQRFALSPGTKGVNHRFLDFYSAGTRRRLPGYGLLRAKPTDWAKAIAWVDQLWEPVEMPCAPWFLEAFPFRRRVNMSDASWPLSAEAQAAILW